MWKVAVVQDDFNRKDTQKNISLMKNYVASCMRNHPGTKLILFPELAVTGYRLTEEIINVAEEREGPAFEQIASLAQQYHVYIGYGFVEKGSNGDIYNSMNLVSNIGKRVATYQKVHLNPLENHLFASGERLVTVETEMGKLGLLICWDLAFPEMARLLTLEGAELLLAPSAWEAPHDWSYRQMPLARAMDNVVYVATCNHVGQAGKLSFFGGSAIFGPDGKILGEAKQNVSDIVVADIDFNLRKNLEETFYTMQSDRRDDMYSLVWQGCRT